MEEALWKGTELYNEKKYREAKKLLAGLKRRKGDTGAQANRTSGWCDYYLGLELLRKKRNGWPQNTYFMITVDRFRSACRFILSTMEFERALKLTANYEIRISALNGLPLSTRFLSRKKAYKWSDQGVDEAKETEDIAKIASAKNTRNVLLREDKRYAEAISGCQMVISLAISRGDFRHAGHGYQNLGDTYKLMLEEDKDPHGAVFHRKEAAELYSKAIEMYKKYEETTGQKATAHIEAATRKLKEVSN